MPIDLSDYFHRYLVVTSVIGGSAMIGGGVAVGCALTAWLTGHLQPEGYRK